MAARPHRRRQATLLTMGDFAASTMIGVAIGSAIRLLPGTPPDPLVAMGGGMAIGMVVHLLTLPLLAPLLGMMHAMVIGGVSGMYGGMFLGMRAAMAVGVEPWARTVAAGAGFGLAVAGCLLAYDLALRHPEGAGVR